MPESDDRVAGSDARMENPPSAEVPVRVGLRVDESDLQTSYANGFRTQTTPDEVFLDLGINVVTSGPVVGGGRERARPMPEMVLTINHRIVLNFPTAKRLAMALADVLQRHEAVYGEIHIDAQKRRGDHRQDGPAS